MKLLMVALITTTSRPRLPTRSHPGNLGQEQLRANWGIQGSRDQQLGDLWPPEFRTWILMDPDFQVEQLNPGTTDPYESKGFFFSAPSSWMWSFCLVGNVIPFSGVSSWQFSEESHTYGAVGVEVVMRNDLQTNVLRMAFWFIETDMPTWFHDMSWLICLCQHTNTINRMNIVYQHTNTLVFILELGTPKKVGLLL